MYCVKVVNTEDELRKLYHVGLSFQQEVDSLRDKPDLEHAVSTVLTMVQMGIARVFGLHDKETKTYCGILIGIVMPDVFSGVLQAQELIWYVLPGYRGKGVLLVDAFEEWSISQGATTCSLCHMVDSMPKTMERFYRMRGYTKQDIIYRKVV